MAVAVRSHSNTTYASRTNTVITAPTGIVDGDILILQHIIGGAGTAPAQTPPAGFQKIGTETSVTDGSFNVKMAIYWKRASSESGSYTVTHSAASSQGVMYAISGAKTTGSPIDAFSQNTGTGSTSTLTSVKTTLPNTLLLGLTHIWDDPAGITPTSGWTQDVSAPIIYDQSKIQTSAGATGNFTFNNTWTYPWSATLLAISPVDTVVFVGANTGTNTLTLPAHKKGDLLIACAFRVGGTSITTPSGWSSFDQAATNASYMRVAYKIAQSSSETMGTWTNASVVAAHVYRPNPGYAFESNPIKGFQSNASSSTTTVTFPAKTFTSPSLAVRFVGGYKNSTTSNVEVPPTGFTLRSNLEQAGTGTAEIAGFDSTDQGLSSVTSYSRTPSPTSLPWQTETFGIAAKEVIASAIGTSNVGAVSGLHAAAGSAAGGAFLIDDSVSLQDTTGPSSWIGVWGDANASVLTAINYDNSSIYESNNQGLSWSIVDAFSGPFFSSVSASSDGVKLVGSVDGLDNLYTSSDSGRTWINQANSIQATWGVSTISGDGTKIAALPKFDQGSIYTSTDGGANWTERTSAGSFTWSGLAASADGETLVAAAQGNLIFTSTDGGANWTSRDPATGGRFWSPPAITDDGQKIVIMDRDNSVIYKSIDGGATWSDYPQSSFTGAAGLWTNDDGSVVLGISDDTDETWKSSDFGETWVKKLSYGSGYNVNLLGDVATIYSSSSTLTTSRDGGSIWESPGVAESSYQNVAQSRDGRYIIAINSSADLLISKNSGQTFHRTEELAGSVFNAWISGDGSSIFVVTGSFFYVSTDHGDTWLQKDYIDARWLTTSYDGSQIAYVGFDALLYTSDDYGTTWVQQVNAGESVAYVTSNYDGSKLAATLYDIVDGQYIFTSDDYGVTWTKQTASLNPLTGNWSTIAYSGDGSLLIATDNNTQVIKSTDNGVTWSTFTSLPSGIWQITAGSSLPPFDVSYDGKIIVITDIVSGVSYISINRGATWNSYSTDTRGWVSTSDAAVVWVGSYGYLERVPFSGPEAVGVAYSNPISEAVGSSEGVSEATAASQTIASGVGSSVGVATVSAQMASTTSGKGRSASPRNLLINSRLTSAGFNWSPVLSDAGLSYDLLGLGVEDGIEYVDIRFHGTATTSDVFGLYFSFPNFVEDVVQGDVLTISCYTKLLAGDFTSLTYAQFFINEFDASGNYLATNAPGALLSGGLAGGSLSTQRVNDTATIGQATTQKVSSDYIISHSSGPVDITIRFGGPQLEFGTTATDYVGSPTAYAVGDGRYIVEGVGSSSGSGETSAIGESTAAAVGSSSGVGIASSIGRAIKLSVGSSDGTTSVSGVGRSTASSSGSATAVGSATSSGESTAISVASSDGEASASASGESTHSVIGESVNASEVTGISEVPGSSASASGSSSVTGVGRSIAEGAGSSQGTSAGSGTGSSTGSGTGSSQGTGTGLGTGRATSSGQGMGTGQADADAAGIGLIIATGSSSGIGEVSGSIMGITSAFGSSSGTSESQSNGASIAEASGQITGSSLGNAPSVTFGSGRGSSFGVSTTLSEGASIYSCRGVSIGLGSVIGVSPSIKKPIATITIEDGHVRRVKIDEHVDKKVKIADHRGRRITLY